MKLTHDRLLAYPGNFGMHGLCHIRVYQHPGRPPVVIAGGLDDNPGTSITNAIETVAQAVRLAFFADGREFTLIEHHPDQANGAMPPSFALVTFGHASHDDPPDDPGASAGTPSIAAPDSGHISHLNP